ncbi:CoA ester lyase [Pseudomonas sp. PAGU 2196]|uniref:HpcH/HpaI aldolase/citrate lyase family protein n=1 Tax=Pseudomonas sp. PAGU 2196 TaxID=2793997 RepID=UPI001EDF54D2|nr:CoA ester lyase [Pseudomonas sp. PAGU 2196]GHS82175.1 CoA ester lyase [Pseudomonas sp. PAGU 2196]
MISFAPRSLLYCSALYPEQYCKSKLSDVMVLDLEDGVPIEQKAEARQNIERFFAEQPLAGMAVRINPLRSNEGLEDLLLLSRLVLRPDIVVMTMLECADEIDVVRANLARGGVLSPLVFVTVETPSCLYDIHAVAHRADGLIFGSADYAASLGVDIGGWQNMLHARSSIVAAAAATGIAAFDTAYFHLDDEPGLLRESLAARDLGFCGKTAIHPRQVAVINQAFTPSSEELKKACAIVEASRSSGEKITRLNALMIGPPFVKQAMKVMQRAQELGL